MSRALQPKGHRDRVTAVYHSPAKGLDVPSKRGRPLFGLTGRVYVPMGEFYALTGTLRHPSMPPYHLYEIHLDDGGYWTLHIVRRFDHLVCRRIHIEGRRCGFSVIDVDRLWVDGTKRPVAWHERLAGLVRWGRR